jgi:D-lactate dehydrogenase
MKIAFFEVHKEEADYLRKALKGHSLEFFEEPIQKVDVKKFKNVEVVSVFIYSQVSQKIMSSLPNLKFLTTRSTGFDHLDLEYCSQKNIPVGNVPFYGENTVAEHSIALLLNLSRMVHKSYLRGIQNDYSIEGLQGFDLKGKTIGILGGGRIGMHVVRIAKGFGMKVKVYDLYKNTFLSEVLGFEYAPLDEILKCSDVLSLHMPYMKQTHHFLNKTALKKTKKGVIIINTARGGLIDTQALYDLLKSGHIGGAGLDVIEGEELIMNEEELMKNPKAMKRIKEVFRDKELIKMDNVIFTPHNAFNSAEALRRILDSSLENIKSFEKTKKAHFPVSLKK